MIIDHYYINLVDFSCILYIIVIQNKSILLKFALFSKLIWPRLNTIVFL